MGGIKPQGYNNPRPAEYFTRFHERARAHDADWIYDLARVVLTPPSLLLYRARAIGVEHVPRSGPVILAPNHFSNWDHFFSGVYMRRRVRFMGKSQLFGTNAVLTFILSHGGVFPVRRGHRDQEAAGRISEPVREMYAALEEKGRRGVIESLREGIGARPEPKVSAAQAQ